MALLPPGLDRKPLGLQDDAGARQLARGETLALGPVDLVVAVGRAAAPD